MIPHWPPAGSAKTRSYSKSTKDPWWLWAEMCGLLDYCNILKITYNLIIIIIAFYLYICIYIYLYYIYIN